MTALCRACKGAPAEPCETLCTDCLRDLEEEIRHSLAARKLRAEVAKEAASHAVKEQP